MTPICQCSACSGTGQIECPDCHGTGSYIEDRIANVLQFRSGLPDDETPQELIDLHADAVRLKKQAIELIDLMPHRREVILSQLVAAVAHVWRKANEFKARWGRATGAGR